VEVRIRDGDVDNVVARMYGIEAGLVGGCNKSREEFAIFRLILYQSMGDSYLKSSRIIPREVLCQPRPYAEAHLRAFSLSLQSRSYRVKDISRRLRDG
jgi:hypothetical protein